MPSLESLTQWVLSHGLRIALALLALVWGLRLVRRAADALRAMPEGKGTLPFKVDRRHAQTLASLIRSGGTVVIGVLAVLVVAGELGFNLAPILAGAGVFGLALGLGAQTLAKDLIAGSFVLLEDQFAVGDTIVTGAHSGLVEAVTLRTTCIRSRDGAFHVIPNGELGRVTNLSRQWAMAAVEVEVAATNDVERLRTLLAEEATALAGENRNVLAKPEVLGLERFSKSSMTFRVTLKTAPQQQEDVARQLRTRLKRLFDREGIELV